MEDRKSPVHLCSLSMSPLTIAQRDLKYYTDRFKQMTPEEREKDEELLVIINRSRWIELSIEYNRNLQLQYVMDHLGSKEVNPKLRSIKIRPAFNSWRKELLRTLWNDVRVEMENYGLKKKLDSKLDKFLDQRTIIASREFAAKNKLSKSVLEGFFNIEEALAGINDFQTPIAHEKAVAAVFDATKEQELLDTKDAIEFSTLPVTVEEEKNHDVFSEDFRKRLQEAIPPIVIDDGVKKERVVKERALVEQKEIVKETETIKEMAQVKKPDNSQNKSSGKGTYVAIAIIILIIAVVAWVLINSSKARNCFTKPTPIPKKGWFGKK